MEMCDHQRSFLELLAGEDQPLLGRRNSFLALEQNGSGGARTSDDNNGKVNGASDGETITLMTMIVTKTVISMTMTLRYNR